MKQGDRVAIVLDGGQQMGMPHRRFHGRTGFIEKRQGVAWVVSVKDGNMQKTVIATTRTPPPIGVNKMSKEENFIDFATVRDMLEGAQDRRGDLTYEQVAALQHAQWAASDNRNGYKTTPPRFSNR